MQDRLMRAGTAPPFFLTSMFGDPKPVGSAYLEEVGESGRNAQWLEPENEKDSGNTPREWEFLDAIIT